MTHSENGPRADAGQGRFRTLFEHANDAIALVKFKDGSPVIDEINPKFQETFVHDDTNVIGRDLDEIVASDDRSDEARQLTQRVQDGEVLRKSITRDTFEGPRHFDWQVIPVDATTIETADQAFTIYIDVTERVEEKRALEASEDRYRQLVATAPTPILIYGECEEVVYANDAAIELLGAETEEAVLGLTPQDFIHPDSRSELVERRQRLIEDKQTVPANELTLLDLKGHEKVILVVSSPITYEGEPAIQTVATNITELKDRERQLQRERDRLNEFAGVLSHDLRNPLNVAEGRLELAMEECESEHLRSVVLAHRRMEKLIDDVLSLARAGRAIGETDAVELAELADRCWRNVETEMATLHAETKATIQADESRLQQLLENLLRNALEHGGDDVTITIGDLQDGFYVEDDGPGIQSEDRDSVLNPGYSSSDEGIRIGLSIVRDIAEAHGWEIAVTDGSDGGARFEFRGTATE